MWRRVGLVWLAACVLPGACVGQPPLPTGEGAGQPDAGPADTDRELRKARGCPAAEAAPRVLFEIPRAGEVSDDFFRLPFPNDLRRRAGRLDLSELPRRGSEALGFDLVDRYARALEREGLAFGLNPTVFFRLSRPPAAGQPTRSVHFVDLTPGAPEYGRQIAHRLAPAHAGRYFCGAGLVVTPATWSPLLPGHRYAVVLTRALTDAAGTAFRADLDLQAALGPHAPSNPERREAWQSYAPLRGWLASTRIPLEDVAGATLFSTQTIDTLAALHTAAGAGAPPRVTELVRCGEGKGSSCDDDRVPACAGASPDGPFIEYRGRIVLPVFQSGTPPYESEGGGIGLASDGRPQIAREEAVCFSLAIPRAEAPATGWPLVVYSHGTGASFRYPIDAGLASELASGAIDEGQSVPLAILGYDGVLHGSRRGSSSRSIEELVYNFANPAAARGNTLQAAVDLFALARALPALAARGLPLQDSLAALYGHSQGGTAAALAAAHEPRYGAVVLSGTGGALTPSLLGKTKPVPIAPLFPFLLGDDAPVDAAHPVLAFLQMYFDGADPLNHAGRLVSGFGEGAVSRHVLHVFGANDQYTPDATQRHLARAAGLPVLHPVVLDPDPGADPPTLVQAPVRANLGTSAGVVTAVQAQYLPEGYDGHFVSTQHPAARATIQRMLGTYFRDGTPVVE